jgi:hypothetical protein
LEVLLKIREEMAREADYDVDFFTEMIRNGIAPATDIRYAIGEANNGKPEEKRSRTKASRKK